MEQTACCSVHVLTVVHVKQGRVRVRAYPVILAPRVKMVSGSNLIDCGELFRALYVPDIVLIDDYGGFP